MNKFIAFILLSTLTMSVFAKDSILTCTIKNPKTKETASVNFDLENLSEEVGDYSEGINSGDDNYSFNMSVEKQEKNYAINVTFQENNNAEDEVGDMSCTYTPAKDGEKVFCYEPLKASNGWTVAIFYCQVK
jgi:hypothetical protein